MTPFRNEKNSNWEGAYRVPAMVRWPGHIPAGQVLNGIVSHNDWFVTLLAAAGDTDIADRLKAGADLARHDLQGPPRRPQPARLPHRRSRREPAPALLLRLRRRRPHRAALRQLEDRVPRAARRRARSTSGPSRTPSCGCPKIFNLRTDPYERADITSNTYFDWLLDHAWVLVPGADLRRARCCRRSSSSRRGRSRPASPSTR